MSTLDDASSTTYVNPDGTSTMEQSASDIRVQRGGVWVPVDLTLVQGADGSYAPRVSPATVTLGGAGSTTVASLAVGGGSVAYGWSSPLPAPSVSGPTATYSGVFPGVDLVATVSTSGVETSLVYRNAQAVSAQPSVSFPLSVSGLTASQGSSGALAYRDGTGAVVASTPAPKAWDSRLGGTFTGPGDGPVDSAGGQVKTNGGASLTTSASTSPSATSGSMVQTVQVPSALTSDQGAVYPLVVDPSVSCTGCDENLHGYVENDGDTEINTTFDGGTAHIGTFDGGTTRTRALYSFKQGASHGTTINSATLELGNVYSWSCSARSATVYKSSAFTSSVTWSSATLATTANAVTPPAYAHGYSSSCPAKQVNYNVTGIVSDGANDSSSYYYFQIRAGSETDSTYWKKFQSSAVLAVTYDTAPNTPSSTGFKTAYPSTPGCARGSSRPTIDASLTSTWQAKVSDPDKNSVKVQFEWWDLATPSTTHTTSLSGSVTSGSDAYASFTGNATTFVDGHSYGFRARAYDGQLYSGWTSGTAVTTCEFHVSDPPPTDPSSLAFALPSLTCPPSLNVRGDQPMAFKAYVSDPDNKYGKTDEAIFKVTVAGSVKWSWTSTYGTARTVTSASMPANTLPDATAFSWSVQAYNGQKYSTLAPSCSATTDNTVPPAPTATAGGTFGSPGTPNGNIGDTDTVTLTSPGAVEFVWEQSTGALTSLPAPGACGSSTPDGSSGGTAYTVCSSQGTGWNQPTLRAMQQDFAVTAVAYTSAGTASPPGSGAFEVSEYPPNHAWLTDQVSIPDNPTTLPDAIGTGGPAMQVTSGGTSWVSSQYPGEDTDPNAPTSGPTTWGTALETDGTGYATTGSATPTLTIDMTHSFTAAVWMRPAHASGSNPDWAMSEDGTVNSGFLLGQFAGYWTFCMPHTQTYSSSYDGDCAYIVQPTDTTQYVGKWTLLTAVWDAQAQQMRLYVNGTQTGTLATASHTSTGATSGALDLGAGQSIYVYPLYTGDILDPTTYAGILDADQLTSLTTCGLPLPIDPNAGCPQ